MVPQSIGFTSIKKKEGEVETPCKTPGRSVERTKNEHEFSWFDSQPVSNQPEHNSQEVMGNLCTNSKDYGALVKALEERFSPPNQADQLSIK